MNFNSPSELPTTLLITPNTTPLNINSFSFINRFWKGVKHTSMDFAQKLLEQRKDWIDKVQIFSYQIKKQYQKEKKVAKAFLEDCHIVFDQQLAKWNYTFCPQTRQLF